MTPQQILDWPVTGYKLSPYFDGTGINTDGKWGWQCKDWANGYTYFVAGFIYPGDAIDLAAAHIPGFVWVPYTAGFVVKAGDLFVLGRPYGYDASTGRYLGHTGIGLTGGTSYGFRSVDQNWNNASLTHGSPPATISHTYSGFLGVQRPVALINNSAGVPMVDDNFLTAFFIDLFGVAPDANQKKTYIGRPLAEVYNELRNSDARKQYLKVQAAELAQLAKLQAQPDINTKLDQIQASINNLVSKEVV